MNAIKHTLYVTLIYIACGFASAAWLFRNFKDNDDGPEIEHDPFYDSFAQIEK